MKHLVMAVLVTDDAGAMEAKLNSLPVDAVDVWTVPVDAESVAELVQYRRDIDDVSGVAPDDLVDMVMGEVSNAFDNAHASVDVEQGVRDELAVQYGL